MGALKTIFVMPGKWLKLNEHNGSNLKMNYALEQRLRMIDFLLFSYGRVSRKIIMDFFGIGEATATRDFAVYKKMAAGNMVLDQSSKMYKKGAGFKREFN